MSPTKNDYAKHPQFGRRRRFFHELSAPKRMIAIGEYRAEVAPAALYLVSEDAPEITDRAGEIVPASR